MLVGGLFVVLASLAARQLQLSTNGEVTFPLKLLVLNSAMDQCSVERNVVISISYAH